MTLGINSTFFASFYYWITFNLNQSNLYIVNYRLLRNFYSYNWIFNNYKETQMHFSANSFVSKRVNQRTEIFFRLKSFFSKEKEKKIYIYYKGTSGPSPPRAANWLKLCEKLLMLRGNLHREYPSATALNRHTCSENKGEGDWGRGGERRWRGESEQRCLTHLISWRAPVRD